MNVPPNHDPKRPDFSILTEGGVQIGAAIYAEDTIPCPCGCTGTSTLEQELAGAFRVARQLMVDGVPLYADGVARVVLTALKARNVVITVAATPDTPKS